ncbi:hypothetical protein BDQ17DRAFT_1323706 [Cyathus striatus]|nr:hypothetical protein BDQ17DRAFT_1323706 [Cyathus striatus]
MYHSHMLYWHLLYLWGFIARTTVHSNSPNSHRQSPASSLATYRTMNSIKKVWNNLTSKNWTSKNRTSKNKKALTLDPKDEIFDDPKSTDLVIAVIGLAGVGKSTLITTLSLDGNKTNVNRTLDCNTHGLTAFPCMHPSYSSQRLVIIDTPGFNEGSVDVTHVLERLSAWLEASYPKDKYMNLKLAGVIYIHETSQGLSAGTSGTVTESHLNTIRTLCGGSHGVLPIVLGMSNWQNNENAEKKCMVQIKDSCWKSLIDHGCSVVQFQNDSTSSACEMVYSILKK